MLNHKQISLLGLAAGLAGIIAHSASADPVSGWGLETGFQNATLTEGAAGSFSSSVPTGNAGPRAVLSAPFDFSDVGDMVHLSGSVTLSGAFGNQQFRFGLFNNNGNALGTLGGGLWTGATASGWLGYIVEPKNINGSGTTALYGRNGSGANAWLSTTAAAYSLSQNADSTGAGAAGGTYLFDLSLSRLSAGSVGIGYAFRQTAGGGDLAISGNFIDNGGLSTAVTSFNTVGFLLNAGTGSGDFSNVEVTVPEPSAFALGIIGLAGAALARRRKS